MMKMKTKILLSVLALAAGLAALSPVRAGNPEIGKPAPDFALKDTEGKKRSLSEHKGKYVVLEWVNHGCPFVRKHYDGGNMQALQKEAAGKGAVWLSICSSAKGKEGHMSPGEWARATAEKGAAPAAVLLDPDGKTGKDYGAATTPHMYIIDPQGVLIYKGAIDDKPSTDPDDIPGSKNYVRTALDEALAGKPVSQPSTKPYGCSVKYK